MWVVLPEIFNHRGIVFHMKDQKLQNQECEGPYETGVLGSPAMGWQCWEWAERSHHELLFQVSEGSTSLSCLWGTGKGFCPSNAPPGSWHLSSWLDVHLFGLALTRETQWALSVIVVDTFALCCPASIFPFSAPVPSISLWELPYL